MGYPQVISIFTGFSFSSINFSSIYQFIYIIIDYLYFLNCAVGPVFPVPMRLAFVLPEEVTRKYQHLRHLSQTSLSQWKSLDDSREFYMTEALVMLSWKYDRVISYYLIMISLHVTPLTLALGPAHVDCSENCG